MRYPYAQDTVVVGDTVTRAIALQNMPGVGHPLFSEATARLGGGGASGAMPLVCGWAGNMRENL